MAQQRKGRKPFVSEADRVFKELAPRAVYADKAGFDFMIPRDPLPGKPPYYLKVEVARMFSARKKGDKLPKIQFRIERGIWSKARGRADFLVALSSTGKPPTLYYGHIGAIADRLHSILPQDIRTKSHKSRVNYFHAPEKLVGAGVMKSLPLDKAHKLVKLLQEAEFELRKKQA